MLSHISHVRLFVIPWTVALQAPLSMGFSRQEYRGGRFQPFPVSLLVDLGTKLFLFSKAGAIVLASMRPRQWALARREFLAIANGLRPRGRLAEALWPRAGCRSSPQTLSGHLDAICLEALLSRSCFQPQRRSRLLRAPFIFGGNSSWIFWTFLCNAEAQGIGSSWNLESLLRWRSTAAQVDRPYEVLLFTHSSVELKRVKPWVYHSWVKIVPISNQQLPVPFTVLKQGTFFMDRRK